MEARVNSNDKGGSNVVALRGAESTLVPVWQKYALTMREAVAYFNIGGGRLREMTDDPDCDFLLLVGNRRLIKRAALEKYLDSTTSLS